MMNFDLGSWMANVKALIPISEIIKIPSQRDKLIKFIEGPSKENEDDEDELIMLQTTKDKKEGSYPPFYMSLHINGLMLHNCMLDLGASTNVMPLKVMNQLGLKVTRPYRNVCGIDSRKIEAHGLIKDPEVHFFQHPDMSLLMDVVGIDVSDAWGMLLSRKWGAQVGGTLQLDLSYAKIPTTQNTYVTLYREPKRKYHVEDPCIG